MPQDQQAVKDAYGIAILYEQVKFMHLTGNPEFQDQKDIQERSRNLFNDKQIRMTLRASELLEDNINSNITIGIMLRDMLEDKAEDALKSEFELAASKKYPELVAAKKLSTAKIDQFCSDYPHAANIVNELTAVHTLTEQYMSGDLDEDDIDLDLMDTSSDYQHICAMGYISDLERAHQSISGQTVNEFNNFPLDGMSLQIYVDDMNRLHKTDAKVKAAFVVAFNTYATEVGLEQRITPSNNPAEPFAVIDATPRRPGGTGPKF